MAYSPMCQGLLTGKYSKDNKPSGPRARLFTEDRYRSVQVGPCGTADSPGTRTGTGTRRLFGRMSLLCVVVLFGCAVWLCCFGLRRRRTPDQLTCKRLQLPPACRCTLRKSTDAVTLYCPIELQVLLDCMRAVADDQGGKTLGQVAINWTMCKGAVPIPGAKNAKQVEEAAGALGWRLTDAQVAELDAVSGKVPPSTGAPFEAW